MSEHYLDRLKRAYDEGDIETLTVALRAVSSILKHDAAPEPYVSAISSALEAHDDDQ